jgi:hypothetical protein
MKITRASGVGGPSATTSARGVQGGEFRVSTTGVAQGPQSIARATSLAGVSSVDALLALQDVGGPLERRRRSVARAGRMLDALEAVKISLLDGEAPSAALADLVGAVSEARMGSDDPKLEGILNEIETRAAVELAKLQTRAAA